MAALGLDLEVVGQRVQAGVEPLLATHVDFALRGDHAAFAQGQALVGDQTPGAGALRADALDARALFRVEQDRKSTRLNSSHVKISYAVFCLKKKTKNLTP